MNQPLISIIIPAYNCAHIIGETLESVLVQTYSKWECIIIDDGSTDETIEVVSKYCEKNKKIKIFNRPIKRNKGPSSCRNIGLEKSIGEYILFLDSDDLLVDFCLQQRVDYAELYQDYDFWIFETNVFERTINNLTRPFNLKFKEYKDSNYLETFFEGKYPFCIMGPLWRKKSILQINGFDENLKIFEDPDMHIRAFLSDLKSKTCIDGRVDSYYRIDKDKTSQKKSAKGMIKIYSAMYLFLKKHLKLNKQGVAKLAIRFYKKEIMANGNFKITLNFYLLYLYAGVFNATQVVLIPIIIIYKMIGLKNKKGLGIYKINRLIFPPN